MNGSWQGAVVVVFCVVVVCRVHNKHCSFDWLFNIETPYMLTTSRSYPYQGLPTNPPWHDFFQPFAGTGSAGLANCPCIRTGSIQSVSQRNTTRCISWLSPGDCDYDCAEAKKRKGIRGSLRPGCLRISVSRAGIRVATSTWRAP